MTRPALLVVVPVALALAACSSGSRLPRTPTGAPALEVRGAVRDGPFQLGAADLAKLPRRTVQGTDPTTGRAARYEGVDLGAVLGQVELRPGADIVVLRTADKRAVPVPLSLVRQYRPVLADRADGAPVEGRVVAWPNDEQRGLSTDPRAAQWWVHGLTGLEVVNALRTYGRALAIPEAAPEGARIGAGTFQWRCSGCHEVRGVGGKLGPDLTRVADRLDAAALQKLLRTHPGWLQPGLEPPGEEAPAQLHTFLRLASALAQQGGADEPKPEPSDEEKNDRPPPPRDPTWDGW